MQKKRNEASIRNLHCDTHTSMQFFKCSKHLVSLGSRRKAFRNHNVVQNLVMQSMCVAIKRTICIVPSYLNNKNHEKLTSATTQSNFRGSKKKR